jgi:energy-coupling factor transport system permease protein
LSLLEGFKFKSIQSPIHKLDPRVKLAMSFSIFLISMMYIEIQISILLLIIQLPIAYIAKILKEWIKSLSSSLFLAAFVFFMNIGVSYFSSGYMLTIFDIYNALALSIRLITLFTAFSIFLLTTTPDELGLVMNSFRIPYDFTFAFIMAVRFVPVLVGELQTILDAQKSRGLEIEKGNLIKRIKNLIPVFIPLLVNVFRRSIELAEALEVKAFGASKKRTNFKELKMDKIDYILLIIIVIMLVIAIYARFIIIIKPLIA